MKGEYKRFAILLRYLMNYRPVHDARLKTLAKYHPEFVSFCLQNENSLFESDKEQRNKFGSLNLIYTSNDNILDDLATFKPEVVVLNGYSDPVMRLVAKWSCKRNIPTVLLSDSHDFDRPRNWWKEKFKGWWIKKHFDSAFVSGSRASNYLINLGLKESLIWRGFDVVNNDYFRMRALNVKNNVKFIRAKMKLPEKYFLYVGRFSPEKNIFRLLESYQLYKNKLGKDAWGLVLVGDGTLEEELKKYADRLGLNDVIWPGFKKTDELPSYYALASCFVLPSTSEPWGLVVNEAMACGLPVLVSNYCGCVPELVHPGINGYVFDPYDINTITFFMERIASDNVDIESMGEASVKIVSNYNPETWAKALTDCISVTISKNRINEC